MILLVARDAVAIGQRLRRRSHHFIGERTHESVAVHAVDDLAVAHAHPPSSTRQQIGRVRHRLCPPRQHDLGLTEADLVRGVHDRPQSGAARLIHRVRRHLVAQAALDGDLSRGIRPDAGLPRIAKDHLIDFRGIDSAAFDRRLCAGDTELRRGQRRQRAAEFADRRAQRRDQKNLFIEPGQLFPPEARSPYRSTFQLQQSNRAW